MTANQFYKHYPYRAGEPNSPAPVLRLEVLETVEERKHIRVRTKGGVKLLLAFDGKAGWFQLLKYTLIGNEIGGRVYNQYEIVPEDLDKVLDAAERWATCTN